jgi:hypothetical protein
MEDEAVGAVEWREAGETAAVNGAGGASVSEVEALNGSADARLDCLPLPTEVLELVVQVLEPTWRGVVRHLSRDFCEVCHAIIGSKQQRPCPTIIFQRKKHFHNYLLI